MPSQEDNWHYKADDKVSAGHKERFHVSSGDDPPAQDFCSREFVR